jgi:hypothetical protein
LTLSTGVRDSGARPIISPLSRRMAVAASAYLPRRVHLPGPLAVVDQARLECCVSCAMASALEVLYVDVPRGPLHHYYVVREGLGRLGGTDGMTLEEGQSFLATFGICAASRHSPGFTSEGAAEEPSEAARADGRELARLFPRLMLPFQPLSDLYREQTWKYALAEGRPLVVEFHVGSDYHREMRWLTDAAPRGPLHAVAILGYDDDEPASRPVGQRGAFIAHDSRGSEWGLGGQWWLGYPVANSARVKRAWALRPPTG